MILSLFLFLSSNFFPYRCLSYFSLPISSLDFNYNFSFFCVAYRFKWKHNIRCVSFTTIHLFHTICILFAFCVLLLFCDILGWWFLRVHVYTHLFDSNNFFPSSDDLFHFSIFFFFREGARERKIKSNTFQIDIKFIFILIFACYFFIPSSSSSLTFKSSILIKNSCFNGYLCCVPLLPIGTRIFLFCFAFPSSRQFDSCFTIMFTCIIPWHYVLGLYSIYMYVRSALLCYYCYFFCCLHFATHHNLFQNDVTILICTYIILNCACAMNVMVFSPINIPYIHTIDYLYLYWMWNALIRLQNPSCSPKLNNFCKCFCT